MFDPILVRRFLLDRLGLTKRVKMPAGAMAARLEAIQIDPVNLLGRNHELALFCRLTGRRADQTDYYEGPDRLFEYIAGNRALLPLRDLPMFLPFMRRREEHLRDEFTRLAEPIGKVLGDIEACGPLTSRKIGCEERLHGYWESSSEAPRTKQTTLAIQYLWECGRLTVTGREGSESVYGLAERSWPEDLRRQGAEMTIAEAARLLREKYYRGMTVFDAGHIFFGWQRLTAAERADALREDEARGLVEPLPIAGIKRKYWAIAGTAERLQSYAAKPNAAQARLIPPLDNLLWRRERLEDLFGFYYRWEIYTPQAKRTSGPYTLPILYGGALVGRLDARMDRKAGALIVERLSYEAGVKNSRPMQRAIEEELDRLRKFCGVEKAITGDICR
jgi:hypothetical protein